MNRDINSEGQHFCVLCSLIAAIKNLEAAHVVPFYYTFAITNNKFNIPTILAASFDNLVNGISLCPSCHTQFDCGNIWVQNDRGVVAESQKETNIWNLNSQLITKPHKVEFFPTDDIWEFRKHWALFKRESSFNYKAPYVICKCFVYGQFTKCINRYCASCCRSELFQTKDGIACKTHNLLESTPFSRTSVFSP